MSSKSAPKKRKLPRLEEMDSVQSRTITASEPRRAFQIPIGRSPSEEVLWDPLKGPILIFGSSDEAREELERTIFYYASSNSELFNILMRNEYRNKLGIPEEKIPEDLSVEEFLSMKSIVHCENLDFSQEKEEKVRALFDLIEKSQRHNEFCVVSVVSLEGIPEDLLSRFSLIVGLAPADSSDLEIAFGRKDLSEQTEVQDLAYFKKRKDPLNLLKIHKAERLRQSIFR